MDYDISINSVCSDEIHHEDFNMDLNDLVTDSPSPCSNTPSPIKRLNIPFHTSGSYMNLNYKPKLSPILSSNQVTNELFQVTSNLRKLHQREREAFDFEINDNDFIPIKRLTNDKIEKLVQDLGMHDSDYELDDQLRARFHKGRFSKQGEDLENDLDNQVSNYLQDNKENFPYPDPLKINKLENNSINKKIYNRNHLRPKKINQKSQIPVLKPLSNLTNLQKDSQNIQNIQNSQYSKNNSLDQSSFTNKSPKRICLPKHRSSKPSKPAIKYSKRNTNIFVVDSSTGLIHDATLFGTELNSSNCNDFPLPEDVNEIVQIPTNDDNKKAKMAIIKVLNTKYYDSDVTNKMNNGFYNQEQFQNWENNRTSNSSGVEVLQTSSKEIDKSKPKVHWPDNLEW